MNCIRDLKNSDDQTLPASSWTLVGNHDRNTANTAHMEDHFNQHFGASTYAFNYGGVHFIVLNNVFSTGKRSYEGRVSDDQLQLMGVYKNWWRVLLLVIGGQVKSTLKEYPRH
ncbi:metallophosphoesterase family protein [Sphingobacterium sp. SGR-19]|uniref:metallophosphoesterase family protein n=1 Tax=Sphingobacterium sp. SGR-19 TaxID=2710886 RepID=UPI0013EE058F|nr:hypothetical protein [Sphingobacterium sp. SGR-19]NGM65119.1 hypothetical protein [Sphingobacterium sp. SGR-19]